MTLPRIVLVDGWWYLLVGKCTALRICQEEDLTNATMDEFATMVQNAMATSDYCAIQHPYRGLVH